MGEYATRLTNGADVATRVRATDALGQSGNTPVRARPGVRNDGGGVVSVINGTMQVQVTPFSAWVDAGSVGQVGFPFVLDATQTLTLDDGHASLDRVDTIAVVADAATPTAATLQVVTGTPGAGAPTLPTHAVPLRDVNVPAGLSTGSGGLASGNLSTDRRGYLANAIIRVSGVTERDALTPQKGWAVFRADTSKVEVYDGSSWLGQARAKDLPIGGSELLTIVSTGTPVLKAVTFPAGWFSAAPNVVVSITDPSSNAPQNFGAGAQTATASGVTLVGVRVGGAAPAMRISWIAVPV